MTEYMMVREFAKQITAAADALDQADVAEKRTARAIQLEEAANTKRAEHEEAMKRRETEAEDHLAAVAAELKAKLELSDDALIQHKKKTDAITETGRLQLEQTSTARDSLNTEIAALRTQRDELNASVAQLRAKVTDLAASI